MASLLAKSLVTDHSSGLDGMQASHKHATSLPATRSSRSISPPCLKVPFTLRANKPQVTYIRTILPESETGITISLVRDDHTSIEYVVKTSPRSLQTEYQIQSSLAAPHITQTHGYYFDGLHHIVMEYCQRLDLFTYMEDKDLTESEAKKLFKQLVEAIETCHRREIVHLDIKPENCFIDVHGILKLGDFGFAREIKKGQMVHEYCGTLAYMSPEVHNKRPFDGTKADIFAAGKVLFEMALGFMPFKIATMEDPNFRLLIRQPVEYWRKKRSYVTENGGNADWNQDLLDLLQRMMSVRPSCRPTIQEVKRHPWLAQNYLPD